MLAVSVPDPVIGEQRRRIILEGDIPRPVGAAGGMQLQHALSGGAGPWL